MTSICRFRLPATVLVATVILATAVAAQTSRPSDRHESGDAERLTEVLAIEAGSTVAEIGAGDGELAIAIARVVGDAGRVFATELGDNRVATLQRAVERAGMSNVRVLPGDPLKTNLDAGCCDAVFMRNVYHHFDDPEAMNRSLFESLRPGGMLAVIDFTPPRDRTAVAPRNRDADGSHGVSATSIAEELKRAGFDIASTETGDRRVTVIARKPAVD